MSWQDRARGLLKTTEVAQALARLAVVSQRLLEAAQTEEVRGGALAGISIRGSYFVWTTTLMFLRV